MTRDMEADLAELGEEELCRRRIWYVLHVKPRTEKKVFGCLGSLNVFRYLPMRQKVSRVQRRKVVRHLPLFPGYVFTRLNADERLKVLKTNHVVRMIEVMRPRQMIHQLRQIVRAGRLPIDLHAVERFSVGERVRMKSGPLMGMEGYVQRQGNATKLVLELTILGRAVETGVDPADVERVS